MNCEDGKGLDLLIADEVLDSADEQGLASVFKALNKTQLTSFPSSQFIFVNWFILRMLASSTRTRSPAENFSNEPQSTPSLRSETDILSRTKSQSWNKMGFLLFMQTKTPTEKLDRSQVAALDIATHCGFYCLNERGTWNFTESMRRKQSTPSLRSETDILSRTLPDFSMV